MSRPFIVVLEALMSLLQLLWSNMADVVVGGKADMGYSMLHTWWCNKRNDACATCLPYVGGMSPGDSPTTTIVTGCLWTFVEHFDRWSLLLANTNLRLVGSRYGHDFLQLIYNSLVAGL